MKQMNYGKYFRLNNNKSDIGKGIVVFDYIWLRDVVHKDCSLEYPIYMAITEESIDFYVHYLDEPVNTNRKEKIIKHLHNVILSLPLSSNIDVKDGLTGALVEGYETNFPTWEKNGSNYLFELLATTIKNNNFEKDNGYSALEEFKVNIEEIKEIFEGIAEDEIKKCRATKDKAFINCIKRYFLVKTICDKNNNKNGSCLSYNYIKNNKRYSMYIALAEEKGRNMQFIFSRFIRKLILDFIFDLEQTHVFHISPYYESISVKLKENYFFSALAAKANFYYQKENLLEIKWILKESDEEYHELQKEIAQLKSQIMEQNLSIDMEYYLKSEMEWTKHIRNPKSEENFNAYHDKWFKDPEDEMKDVYSARRKLPATLLERLKTGSEKGEKLVELNKTKKKLSDKWRVAHYDLWWNWRSIFPHRLFISTLATWITYTFSGELWSNSDGSLPNLSHPCTVKFFCSILIIASYAWILHFGLKRKINIRFRKKILYYLSSLWITSMGFCYSLAIGEVITWIYEKLNGKDLCFHFSDNMVAILKQVVAILKQPVTCWFWIGVCLAMFISVVVQSFQSDKHPTEAL